jgi:2,4-dienoyl-CoA reductase-like NADH-dependent reductase (Old Yellow Enzyme family)
MWGGEAVAVRHDGRANPHQLLMNARTQPAIAALREELVAAHRDRFGANADRDLYVGLQLTHSGRYARPDVYDRPAPIAACRNPILDRRFPAACACSRTTSWIAWSTTSSRRRGWRATPASASSTSRPATAISDTSCSAPAPPGPYGGALENRTRFMRPVIEAIRASVSGLEIAVRISVFDTVPYRKRASDQIGEPEPRLARQPQTRRQGFGS